MPRLKASKAPGLTQLPWQALSLPLTTLTKIKSDWIIISYVPEQFALCKLLVILRVHIKTVVRALINYDQLFLLYRWANILGGSTCILAFLGQIWDQGHFLRISDRRNLILLILKLLRITKEQRSRATHHIGIFLWRLLTSGITWGPSTDES